MPARTPTELNYLREEHPHVVTMYMSIHVPSVVFRGTVSNSPARGANQIDVSTVAGSLADAIAGQTILVGTTSGDDDVSRRRFRSRSGSIITLDENSVVWALGQHITILQNWELWPVFPFIETEAPYTFYKDKDIAYSDQNDLSDPVAIIASNNFAGFIYGSSRQLTIDGSQSYATAAGATIVSYAWSSTGGVISSPASASTTITFTTANSDGDWLFLTVTDSNGKTHTTRRVLFTHTKTGAHVPHANFQLRQSPTGDWGEGGWRASITKYIDASVARVPKGALVLLWSEEFYDGERVQIGEGRTNEMCGYIRDETIVIDRESNTTSFDITTIHGMMRKHKMFSVSLEDSDAPDTWYKYKDLTLPRAVHHFWRWHSTLFDITNVFLPMDNEIPVQAVDDFVNGDLYSMVNTFTIEHGIFAHVCCNKFGEVHVEVDVNMLSDANRNLIDTVMEITDIDRREDPPLSLQRSIERSISYVMLSGTAYDGTDATPIIAKSPGEVPYTDGPSDISMERQVLEDQDDANEKAGRVDAVANNIFKRIPIAMAGNYSFIDIVPQEWYTITIQSTDNNREISITKRMLPRTVVNNYDNVNGLILTDVIFEGEATGEDGIAGEFPVEVPPTPAPGPPSALGGLVAFDEVNGCYVRGSWTQRNGGLTGANKQDHHGGRDPFWRVKQASSNISKAILWKCDSGKIYRSANCGVSWTNMTPGTNPPNTHSDSPAPTVADLEFIWYEGSYFTQNRHIFLARWANGSGAWRSWLLLTSDDGATSAWKSVTDAISGGGGGSCHSETPDYGTENAFSAGDTEYDGSISGYSDVAGQKAAIKLSDTKFAVAWIDTGSSPQKIMARCGTLFGGVITWGTAVEMHESGADAFSRIRAIGINDDVFLLVFVEDQSGFGVAHMMCGNISGTSIIPTAVQEFGPNDAYALNINRVDDDTAILVYNDPATSSGIYAYVGISVGSAPTIGPVNTIVNTGVEPGALDICALSATEFVVLWVEDVSVTARTLKALCFSGTAGPAVTIASHVFPANTPLDNIRIEALTSSKFVVSWRATTAGGSNSPSRVRVGTVSGNTITLGSTQDYDAAGHATVDRSNSMAVLNSSCVVLTVAQGNRGYSVIASISGTTCTFSSKHEDPPTAVSGKRPETYSTVALSSSRYLTAYVERSADGGEGQAFSVDVGEEAEGGDAKAFGMSISKEDGSLVYVTYQDEASQSLGIVSFSVPALVEQVRTFLGPATLLETLALTYIAYPTAGWFDNDVVYVFGRIAYTGVNHILKSTDGGLNFSIVEEDWGADHCGALVVDKHAKIHAIRNIAGTGGKLYVGLGPVYPKATLPFLVENGALVCTIDGTHLVAGAKAVASGDMIRYGYPPYTAWLDITEDFPTNGNVTGLVIL